MAEATDTAILLPVCQTNPIVFLDIQIEEETLGRIIIELRKDVVPKTAENFRALCTGEKGVGQLGKPLHYKGNNFHKLTRVYVAQAGDIINNNGTSGESIYGPFFEDENFDLKHEEGVVSMANCNQPNTNNSQFFITSVVCTHLNGTNVVFGRVLRGLACLMEMEQLADREGVPEKKIFIRDCGELQHGQDWGSCDDQETADKFPTFPQDWEGKSLIYQVNEIMDILTCIRNAGNHYFKAENYIEALRKYKKAHRYYTIFSNKFTWKEEGYHDSSQKVIIDGFCILNLLNIAAVEIKFGNFLTVRDKCNEVIRMDNQNCKGYFRRGIAHLHLKNYDEAIRDLIVANQLTPGNKQIIEELNKAQLLQKNYDNIQREALKNLFSFN